MHKVITPEIRRIGGLPLYIGNEDAADPRFHDRDFEHVLTLTFHEKPLTTHHRWLIDGQDCEYEAFAEAVRVAERLINSDGSVLIHCHAGQSRSVSVTAAALASQADVEWDEALAKVCEFRPVGNPHPELERHAKRYLGEKRD